MKVKCPKCGKDVDWNNNKWRPFCSQRCKVIDLASWIDGEYRVSGERYTNTGKVFGIDGIDSFEDSDKDTD